MECIVHYFLREYRIRGEFFNCTLDYINDIINECIKLEERTEILDDPTLKIKRILLDNFEVGEPKDFIKLKDLKELLKNNGLKEIDIISIVEETFDNVFYKTRKIINGKNCKNIFLSLKKQ